MTEEAKQTIRQIFGEHADVFDSWIEQLEPKIAPESLAGFLE